MSVRTAVGLRLPANADGEDDKVIHVYVERNILPKCTGGQNRQRDIGRYLFPSARQILSNLSHADIYAWAKEPRRKWREGVVGRLQYALVHGRLQCRVLHSGLIYATQLPTAPDGKCGGKLTRNVENMTQKYAAVEGRPEGGWQNVVTAVSTGDIIRSPVYAYWKLSPVTRSLWDN